MSMNPPRRLVLQWRSMSDEFNLKPDLRVSICHSCIPRKVPIFMSMPFRSLATLPIIFILTSYHLPQHGVGWDMIFKVKIIWLHECNKWRSSKKCLRLKIYIWCLQFKDKSVKRKISIYSISKILIHLCFVIAFKFKLILNSNTPAS